MAKDSDDGDLERMTEDSLSFLEQARKGKQRTFVMSVKGSAVRSLLVKKKSIKDGDMKAARGSGFQPVFGTVSGSGPQLVFTIAKADGFDAPPGGGKVEKLKKFLSEQTGKTVKPEWIVVDELPPQPFDEDDLKHPLIARFVQLEPLIPQAGKLKPDVAQELKQAAISIRDLLLDAQTIDQATNPIDALEKRLKSILDGSASTSSNQLPPSQVEPSSSAQPTSPQPREQTQDTAPNDNDTLATKLGEALKKLRPMLEQVLQLHPQLKTELVGAMSQIVGAIKSGQLDQAKQDLVAYGGRLKSLLAQQSEQSSEQSSPQSQEPDLTDLLKRRDVLEPLLLQAQSADREKSTKLGAAWQMASQFIDAKDSAKATQVFNALEKSINDILSATANKSDAERLGIREGIVQEMRERLTGIRVHWSQILQTASREIQKVQDGVREADPELADELSYVLEDYYGKLFDLAARFEKAATEEEVQRGLEVLGKEAEELKARFDQDPVLPFLDRYPFQAVSVASTFEKGFAELSKMLKLS